MPPLSAALPGLTFLALVPPLAARLGSWPRALGAAGLILLGLVAGSSELLSAFGQLNRGAIATAWCLFAGAAFALAWRHQRQLRPILDLKDLPRGVLLVVPVAVLTLLVALLAPPNTWDGMTYHLSRVVHWIDQGSLAFYPTAIPRQNYMPPLAEEFILHLQVLSLSDHLANLPAWSYFLLSLVMVGVVAGDFGLDRQGQAWAVAFAAVLPMALAQATSCKNDPILGFLFLAFCHHLMRLHEEVSARRALPAALALGLGLYCKGSFLLLGAGAGLAATVLAAAAARPLRLRGRHLGLLVGLAAAGFVLSSPHWIRQQRDGPEDVRTESERQRNQDLSARGVGAIAIRNLAVHLTLPVAGWDEGLRATVGRLLGEALNDPRTTFLNFPFQPGYNASEEQAGNPVHLLVALAATAVLLGRFRRLTPSARLGLLGLLLATALLVTLIKWQPWISRLHTPFFLLAAPLSALALRPPGAPASRLRTGLAWILLGLAAASALPVLVNNPARPLLGDPARRLTTLERNAHFFAYSPGLYAEYRAVDDLLRRSDLQGNSIALLCGEDDLEYPLLRFAGAEAGSARAAYRFHTFDPRRSERIVLGLGEKGRGLLANPNARAVFQGGYITIYVGPQPEGPAR